MTELAEFFAVATETFFQRARELKQAHPRIYEQLSKYYRLDPASWREGDADQVAGEDFA